MKKGQYFSLDAIVASIIFLLALTVLLNHWYAIRTQIDDSSDYLQYEAHRISNILLGPGDPADWYRFVDVKNIRRAGFGVGGNTQPVELAYSESYPGRHFERAGFGGDASADILNPSRDNYDQSRDLLGTSAHYFVSYDLKLANIDDLRTEVANGDVNAEIHVTLGHFGGEDNRDPNWGCIESDPLSCTFDMAKVERRVFVRINDSSTLPAEPHYVGNMTVYTWLSD